MTLTDEQAAIIECNDSLFICACAGAGKTKVVIERARRVLSEGDNRALAFLSFTNAAVEELESRLRSEGLLDVTPFPHFIGTFDRFLWHFFVAPFGIPQFGGVPRLIDDLEGRLVGPPYKRGIPLGLFDTSSGKLNLREAARLGFELSDPKVTAAYESAATQARGRFLQRGEIGYAQVRQLASQRCTDPVSGPALGRAIAARFREFIVDETQDCNLEDLGVIRWLRDTGVALKVLCDPNQAIYGFRGGAGEHIESLESEFAESSRRVLTGNFRSSSGICAAVSALRPDPTRPRDIAVGSSSGVAIPVQVISYAGSVCDNIGGKYRAICVRYGLSGQILPLVASTRDSAAKAAGSPEDYEGDKMSIRLALAVDKFYRGTHAGNLLEALDAIHKVALQIGGHLQRKTYGQHLSSEKIESPDWRPKFMGILRALSFEGFTDARTWLDHARSLLSPYLQPGSRSIAQVLSYSDELQGILAPRAETGVIPQTIHSVKGLEFPAICVLLTKNKAKGIIDLLVTGEPKMLAEDARKIYVAASRARKLLVIAVPKSQATRLKSHLEAYEVPLEMHVVDANER